MLKPCYVCGIYSVKKQGMIRLPASRGSPINRNGTFKCIRYIPVNFTQQNFDFCLLFTLVRREVQRYGVLLFFLPHFLGCHWAVEQYILGNRINILYRRI